jgi:hypothetical protein
VKTKKKKNDGKKKTKKKWKKTGARWAIQHGNQRQKQKKHLIKSKNKLTQKRRLNHKVKVSFE